jgi:hypothetical protein
MNFGDYDLIKHGKILVKLASILGNLSSPIL